MPQSNNERRFRSFVALPGSLRKLLPNSRPAGQVDLLEPASITVRIRAVTDPAQLDKAVEDLSAQPLASRRYLTREELAGQHGARPEDLDAVEQYAQQHNLVVTHRSAAERTLVLSGTLGDVLNAFHADVHLFHHASGDYRGRQGEIYIPSELAGIITGIFGFDTRPKHKSPHRQRSFRADGPGGVNGVAATTFAQRYNFPTANQGVPLDGGGQCIAIIELGGGYKTADLRAYFQEIGVAMPKVTSISIDHAHNRPTKTGPADGEVMLDIEVAGAVAPKAKIAVYFAPNRGNGFLDAVTAAIHDAERNPSVISISWGEPEDFMPAQTIKAFHEVFSAAAALGITVCAASGDHGVADLDGFHWDGAIHVDHPAADDLVLACGGTQIDQHGHESAWNDGTPFGSVPGGGGWAGGGGVSVTVALPAYQKDAKVPPSLASSKVGRGVPDIAMSATNYFTRVQGEEGASGGTSAVAPLMAGLVALLNQAKQKNVGFLNPFLYLNQGKGVVRDIGAGTNGISGTVKGYDARKGWDPCTGLGTPDGAKILQHL
jgi:kumamolisin